MSSGITNRLSIRSLLLRCTLRNTWRNISHVTRIENTHRVNAMESETIWSMIKETYKQAQVKEAVRFTETRSELLEEEGFEYILKISSNLRSKPKPKKEKKFDENWKNPFLPPEPDLFVGELSDTHSLVLNKFNIVPYHTIVITKEFEKQESPLNCRDFEACWRVLQALPNGGLVYFNCGEHSGASQPHKHLQCIPLPLATVIKDFGDETWVPEPYREAVLQTTTLGDAITVPSLPFFHVAAHIDITSIHDSGKYLESIYWKLMEYVSEHLAGRWSNQGGSYNLLLTCEYMMVVPRSQESIGNVSCNAMGYAGSFFVAGQYELDEVKQLGPGAVLCALGYSPLRT